MKELAPNVAALIYRVTARWNYEEKPIKTLNTSIYVKQDGGWKIALHQQSAIA